MIPAEAEIGIRVRSFSAAVRALLRERITALVNATAEGYGAKSAIRYVEGYPVLKNDPAAIALAGQVASELVGRDRVDLGFPRMGGSEDFAYMLQAFPGALVRVGNGPSDGGRGLHNPRYDFHDGNLSVGAAFWSRLAEQFRV